jgi:hypothetical protein
MDTNTQIKISKGGGLLSQFQVLLDYFYHNPQINIHNDLYIDKGPGLERLVTDYLKEPVENFYKMSNWWDYVLNQSSPNISSTIEVDMIYSPVENYFTDKGGLKKLEFSKNFISSKLSFHPELLSLVDYWENYFKIDKNTLAVHLRLTDLNDAHSTELGKCFIEDYVKVINLALKENPNINKIFVASESLFNIQKLQSLINIPIHYIPELTRTSFSEINEHLFYKEQVKFLKQPNYSREVFLDLMLLAKCRILVGRISAVTNTSIILNNHLEKYYCTNQVKLTI